MCCNFWEKKCVVRKELLKLGVSSKFALLVFDVIGYN